MADIPETGAIERPEDVGTDPSSVAKYWCMELYLADQHEQEWRKRGRKVIERYRDDKRKAGKRFNILWSNTETLKPAIFSQVPEPDVRRRFADPDPVGREAAETLERALSYVVDDYPFDRNVENARDDMLLPGRGVIRVRYEADVDELPGYADLGIEPVEVISDQRVWCEHVYWEDVRFFPAGARCWTDVYGVGFRHLFTRDELVEEFGAVGKRVPLSADLAIGDEDTRRDGDGEHEPLKRAEVWEIWDKRERERIWISEAYKEGPLDTEDDPLGLEGFFPMPEPLYAVKTTDSMVPVPEFSLYQDQADELDKITGRISALINAMKVRGLYAAAAERAADLLKGNDLEMIPVTDWERLVEKGGIEKMVAYLPVERLAQVLVALYQQRDTLRQEIFEITGISDVIRGATKSSETATAQQLKSNFGQFRMIPRRMPMERFIRDIYRLKAEIIAEHFEPETLQAMTGREINPQIVELLRDDKMRGFRVDVETESTVQPNADQQRDNAVAFSEATVAFMKAAADIGQANPLAVPLLLETYKHTARKFKAGRTLEDMIEQAIEQMKQQIAQPQQPQPDPEMILKAKDAALREEEADLRADEQQRKALETAWKLSREMAEDEVDVPDAPQQPAMQ